MVTKITLPIYYKRRLSNKQGANVLVGLNWYRNAHYRISGDVKKRYHELVKKAIGDAKFDKVRIKYTVFIGRRGTDGGNVRSVIEKFFLDGLVECGAIPDDDITHVVGDESHYFIDRDNPRIEIEIVEQNPN